MLFYQMVVFILGQVAIGRFGELQKPENASAPFEDIDATGVRVIRNSNKEQNCGGELNPPEGSCLRNLKKSDDCFLGGYVCRCLKAEITDLN
ncbi:MAG: hypothetical protein WAM39_17115 [Bryobacteraceae bacterium]